MKLLLGHFETTLQPCASSFALCLLWCPVCYPALQMCPSTSVEVYDLNQPLDIPWDDFNRAKAVLDSHRDSGGNRFDWKRDAMATGEQVGWELWERSSYLYLLVRPSS